MIALLIPSSTMPLRIFKLSIISYMKNTQMACIYIYWHYFVDGPYKCCMPPLHEILRPLQYIPNIAQCGNAKGTKEFLMSA